MQLIVNCQSSTLQEYSEKLKAHSNSLDIILLSAGEDGHIASLFPEHDSIENNEEYFITVSNSPKPPDKRISASRKLLSKSKVGILALLYHMKKAMEAIEAMQKMFENQGQ